jgi:Fe2+ or Zn2+ uptake regulation protein
MNFMQILKEYNLRATQPRLRILEELSQTDHPITIDDLQKSLGVNMETSTLYRSLKKMSDAGIVYQTDFRDGKAYFELQDKHHHHVTCTKCGTREDIDICIAKEISPLEKKLKQFQNIKSHMLEFFGVCNKCEK